jgi:hypothetical protein
MWNQQILAPLPHTCLLEKTKYIYSRAWHLETRDLETRFDREHHFNEKIARLLKYVDSIGSNGYLDSALETGSNISIHIRVSRCQNLLYIFFYYYHYK